MEIFNLADNARQQIEDAINQDAKENDLRPGAKYGSIYSSAFYTEISTFSRKVGSGAGGAVFYLPLPKELDGAGVFSADWQQQELAPDFINSLLLKGASVATGNQSIANAGIGALEEFLKFTGENLGIGGAVGALEQAGGVARNPRNTLLFKNMNLRSYQFTWDLIPFTPNRANLWSAAIKQLRLFMHPTKGTYGYLTPKLFKVKIYAANKVIFSSELSALTSLVVNPFGSGPAFHKDGNPVHTILTTEFQEIVTLTTDEISKLYP